MSISKILLLVGDESAILFTVTTPPISFYHNSTPLFQDTYLNVKEKILLKKYCVDNTEGHKQAKLCINCFSQFLLIHLIFREEEADGATNGRCHDPHFRPMNESMTEVAIPFLSSERTHLHI